MSKHPSDREGKRRVGKRTSKVGKQRGETVVKSPRLGKRGKNEMKTPKTIAQEPRGTVVWSVTALRPVGKKKQRGATVDGGTRFGRGGGRVSWKDEVSAGSKIAAQQIHEEKPGLREFLKEGP